jgi:eukaryotic-like serine/threonine-protein kinase
MGAGGSGRIWAVARVGQLGFNKRMVLKVMRHDKLSSARAHERFDREACVAGSLSHANVRAVHDLGSHEGRPFMAMSWVDTSLAELLEHAPGSALDADVVCWIGMQCCSALVAAHSYVDHVGEPRPIVHRDVSPGNILLTAEGHALLADLTAPAAEPLASPHAGPAHERRFFGSLGYAAPEALRQEPLDGRSDLFSLGCVLYEALAGALAFEGDDEPSVVFQILERGPPELASRAPAVPSELAAVVHRCLERRPEHRFQSATELRAALSACCRKQSAFALEQRAAAVIQEVLGGQIRAREEAMHLAFERFAPAPFERTDTLPIAHLARGDNGSTLNILSAAHGAAEVDRESATSHSGAPMAISRRAPTHRRPLWMLGVLGASLLVYGLYQMQPPFQGVPVSAGSPAKDPPETRSPGDVPAPTAPPAAASPPPLPAPAEPVTHGPSAAGGPGAPSESSAGSAAAASPRASLPETPRTRAKAAPRPPRERSSPPEPEVAGGSRAERKPFVFHFDGDNPYDGQRPPAGATATPPARDGAPRSVR